MSSPPLHRSLYLSTFFLPSFHCSSSQLVWHVPRVFSIFSATMPSYPPLILLCASSMLATYHTTHTTAWRTVLPAASSSSLSPATAPRLCLRHHFSDQCVMPVVRCIHGHIHLTSIGHLIACCHVSSAVLHRQHLPIFRIFRRSHLGLNAPQPFGNLATFRYFMLWPKRRLPLRRRNHFSFSSPTMVVRRRRFSRR